MRNKIYIQGFTLVELLVVVSIISILSVIGVTIFGQVQVKSRDARRKADIDAISKAYELAYDPDGPYNQAYRELKDTDFQSGKIPRPPEGDDYTYKIKSGYTYTVCASLEGGTKGCEKTFDKCYCKSAAQGGSIIAGGVTTGILPPPAGVPYNFESPPNPPPPSKPWSKAELDKTACNLPTPPPSQVAIPSSPFGVAGYATRTGFDLLNVYWWYSWSPTAPNGFIPSEKYKFVPMYRLGSYHWNKNGWNTAGPRHGKLCDDIEKALKEVGLGQYWIVGNEPNIGGEDSDGNDNNIDLVVTQTKIIVDAIKSVDVSAKLVAPSVVYLTNRSISHSTGAADGLLGLSSIAILIEANI